MSASKPKAKKKNKARFSSSFKGIALVLIGIALILALILKSSLWKDYPVEGKKQLLAIESGQTYSGFIDRLATEDQVSFPIILKLYQRIMIHDTIDRKSTRLNSSHVKI